MTASCVEMRERLTEYARGALNAEGRHEVDAHVKSCAGCAEALAREAATEDLLGALPRHSAPAGLAERVRARVKVESVAPPATPSLVVSKPRKSRWGITMALAAAVAGAVTAFVLFVRSPSPEPLVMEAVNDHLRILYAQNPLEVAASDHHQVKPWFSGKVDFAPILKFGGDDEFPLTGGAVALFVDRKAALFVFKRRLHEITLLNFRSESLPWPHDTNATIAGLPVLTTTRDGFHVIMWKADELGYALTSDLSEPELRQLAALLIGGSAAPAR